MAKAPKKKAAKETVKKTVKETVKETVKKAAKESPKKYAIKKSFVYADAKNQPVKVERYKRDEHGYMRDKLGVKIQNITTLSAEALKLAKKVNAI